MRLLLALICLCSFFSSLAQNRIIDSLNASYPSAHDTVKVRILIRIANSTEGNDANAAFKLVDSAAVLCKRISYTRGLATCYSSMGSCLTTAGKYDQAISYLHKALKIFESLQDKRNITNTLNSLGNAFATISNNDKSYDYYLKAYNMATTTPKDEYLIAITSVGVGNSLIEKNDYKAGVGFYKNAESYFRKANIKQNEALCMLMIGEANFKDSNFVEAEKYYTKALPIFKEENDQYGLASNYVMLGSIAKIKGDYNLASKYYRMSLDVNLKRKAWTDIRNSSQLLSEVYERLNRPVEALVNYKLYLQYNDSIINVERNKAIAESESKYKNEKREQQLQLKNVELEKSQLEVTQRNYLIFGFVVGLAIFLVLLFFVYRQYIEKKKANVLLIETNEKIEQQSFLLEEKNKDITDSINYSKHIQQAILPPETKVHELLPNSFVVFKPKDIVSGDFYLVEEVNGLIYIAVVDCTGHGVPGAMLSVFAYSTIKNIITSNNFGNNPAAILTNLCLQFKNNLRSNSTTMSINDGVDMGICIIDKVKKKLYFAGAKNSLMLIRDNAMMDFLADRWGISGSNSDNQLTYTNHIIDIKVGDKYYLSTDGYQDQFGGLKGKKFKLKQLKQLLLNQFNLSFKDQGQMLDSEFVNWQGKLEQIDDVTIIGFEV